MAEPIGPGDWIRRIDDLLPDVPRGTVMRCEDIDPEPGACLFCGPNAFGLFLSVGPGAFFACWCPNHWEVIYRPSQSLFLEQLMDVPAPEKVEA